MHLVDAAPAYPATSAFIEAFDAEDPSKPWAGVLAAARETLREVFSAAAAQHAGFAAASARGRAAYGCDFILTEDRTPLLLEVTFAPAPLWSSDAMPETIPGVADDIFRTLYFGDGANVTRC